MNLPLQISEVILSEDSLPRATHPSMRAAYGTAKRGVAVASMGDEVRAGDEADRFSRTEIRVEGLETLDYLDNTQNRKRCTEQGDALTFESELYGIPGIRRRRL
ncbi:hypothetical protein ACFX19_037501 [Malus domestica]